MLEIIELTKIKLKWYLIWHYASCKKKYQNWSTEQIKIQIEVKNNLNTIETEAVDALIFADEILMIESQ